MMLDYECRNSVRLRIQAPASKRRGKLEKQLAFQAVSLSTIGATEGENDVHLSPFLSLHHLKSFVRSQMSISAKTYKASVGTVGM